MTASNTVLMEMPCDLVDTVRAREKWGHGVNSGLRMSIAVGLYVEHAVSLGKAAELAGIAIQEFEALLRRAGLPTAEYTETELNQDLAFVRECTGDVGHGA